MRLTSENSRAATRESEPSARARMTPAHIAKAVKSEAEKIAINAGSTARTSEAFNRTVEHLSNAQREDLARRLGFGSFSALLGASTVITLADGAAWCLTATRSGNWTAWNICALDY